MRRLIFSLIALFALSFTSCDKLPFGNEISPEIETGNHFRVLSESVISMPAEGGNAEIEYVIDTAVEGGKLTATTTTEWITNIEVNDTVILTIDANMEHSNRIGMVTLSYATTSIVIGIDQEGRPINENATFVINSERTMEFDAAGGNGTISYTITGGDEGDKVAAESNEEWIEILDIDSDTVGFKVAQNTKTSTREGIITLNYGSNSNTVQIKQAAATTELTLTADRGVVRLGESVSFTATFANNDVTASSKIVEYYTRKEIPNPYTPTEIAELSVIAEYNGYTSKIVTVNVVSSDTPLLPEDSAPESYDFNQRILLIDHTGAGCSYCPAAKEAFNVAEESANYKDKFNVVYAYSFDGSGAACYSSASKTLWNYFVQVCSTGDYLTGYPSFTTNYCFNYTGKYNVIDRINEFWDKNVSASLALATKRDGNKLVVNAAVKSSKDQHFKLSLWLLEDDIYATQAGATASWMHTHHNVMRDAITGISKSDIAGVDFGYVAANSTYERVMTFDLFVGSSWNINNCKLIAIISAPSTKYNGKYEVVTTTICDLDGSVGFDYKK